MDNRRLHRSLVIGAILIAALLFAPYFGIRLLRKDGREPAYSPVRADSPQTISESSRETRTRSIRQKEAGTGVGEKSIDHTLSEVEELLK